MKERRKEKKPFILTSGYRGDKDDEEKEETT